MIQEKQQNLNVLDNKYSKIKMMSGSASTNTLMRQYRQSSGGMSISSNSTSSSNSNNFINNLHRKSGSTANLNY